MIRLALVLAAAAVLTAGAAPAGRAWDGCTPRGGDVRLRAADGVRLVGHRFGTGPKAVVLAHERNGSMCEWASYARRLAGLGYTAFTIDFRGNGDSQADGYVANRLGGDVAAAVRYVRAHGARKVFLLGASIGGSAAIDAAANLRQPPDGVVSVSGAAGLADASNAVRRVRVPSLFAAGAGDTSFADDARTLYAASPATDKTLDVLPGAFEHGTDLVAAHASLRAAVERFIATH